MRVEPLRALIVDDYQDTAEVLRQVMSLFGCITEIAFSGSECLYKARTFRPHLLLLDISLPDMDGYEVADRLRADPHLATIRLVAITGHGYPKDRERTQAAGFWKHLLKPVGIDQLRELIQELK
jgi:two-component system CheB/CheR fusion protein